MKDWYWTCGGGAGDVLHSYLHDSVPTLFKTLCEDYYARIMVLLVTHNPGAQDIFRYSPWIEKVVLEPWKLPNREDEIRFANPIGNYLPLNNPNYLFKEVPADAPRIRPEILLNQQERAYLHELCGKRPLIVAQPYAGLSDRDGFDSAAFERLVNYLAAMETNCRVVCLGFNHDRGHKYTREELHFEHPNLINLIDKTGLRFNYHLVRSCDAFVGSHSNLIRVAWDFRKRNACVLPWPLMENHLNTIDNKYTYGWRYPESAKFTFPMEAPGAERHFEQLDCEQLAYFLLGR